MAIATILRLTIQETQRRRILWIGTLMGFLFLFIFGLGFHFMYRDIARSMPADELELPIMFLTLAGLYAANFIVIMISVLISVTTISGEVESHTVESLLTKPIGRWELILGKWLGYAIIIFIYVLLLPGGVLFVVYLRAGFVFSNLFGGLMLIYLEGLLCLTLSIAGGTRLSTLANGALAFMLFGVAFVGGWVEQIGSFTQNEAAVNVGIVTSFILPTEVLWRKATALFAPQTISGFDFVGPFTVSSQPSDLMIIYTVLYILGLFALALRLFSKRDL